MRSAFCTREIYWKGKTYKRGDPIEITKEDAYILFNAGVIGDLKKVQDIEFAVREAPENAKKIYKKRNK